MLSIEMRIDAVEINGEALPGLPAPEDQLKVLGHWNDNDLVVIEWHGARVTVLADELRRGIANATNHD